MTDFDYKDRKFFKIIIDYETRVVLGRECLGIGDVMDEFGRSLNFARSRYQPRIKTGIDRLDDLISGGLPSNSITLVSGTPGSGKTILCFH